MSSLKWDAGGLISGLRIQLSDDDATLIEQAIERLEVVWEGHRVRAPGSKIWNSLAGEDFDQGGYKSMYQAHFGNLISTLRTGRGPAGTCCAYHTNLLHSCTEHMADPNHKWFSNFLELLTATAIDLHFQYLSTIDLSAPQNKQLELSRFMKLEVFIPNHCGMPYTDAIARTFRDQLSPRFGRGARRSSWRGKELGTWNGRVGSYPGWIGAAESYQVWCENIKPFATPTSELEACDRNLAPSRTLQQLGIPFAKGQYWIELIYEANSAAFHHAGDDVRRLAIPTHVDSAGNWAFVPDRGDELSNYTRDLLNGKRGLRELVHQRFDIDLLDDAIVWQTPTELDWPQPSSPFVEGAG